MDKEKSRETYLEEVFLNHYTLIERFCFRMVNYDQRYRDIVDDSVSRNVFINGS